MQRKAQKTRRAPKSLSQDQKNLEMLARLPFSPNLYLENGKIVLSDEKKHAMALSLNDKDKDQRTLQKRMFEISSVEHLPAKLELARSHIRDKQYTTAYQLFMELNAIDLTKNPGAREVVAAAKVQLGKMYEYGDIKKDIPVAFKYYQEADVLGDAEGTFRLALLCEDKKDEKEAGRLYLKSADNGYSLAQYELGYKFLYSSDPSAVQQALKWLHKAADNQMPSCKALYRLAVIYDKGIYADKDDQKAFQYCEKAAKEPHCYVEAQYRLAVFYSEGVGVERNDNRAFFWYEQAALNIEAPDKRAQFELGVCFELGRGVARDNEKALYWYEKSASRNHSRSLLKLGDCYRLGKLGQAKDDAKAMGYYEQEAQFVEGDPRAKYYFAKYLQKSLAKDEKSQDEKKKAEMIRYFLEAARERYAPACLALYSLGTSSYDVGSPLEWLKDAAEDLRYPKAQYQYANYLLYEELAWSETSIDEKEDIINLLKDSIKKYPPSLRLLAKIYTNGTAKEQIIFKPDEKSAVALLEKGIQKNDPFCMLELACLCETGRTGFQKDEKKSLELYLKFYQSTSEAIRKKAYAEHYACEHHKSRLQYQALKMHSNDRFNSLIEKYKHDLVEGNIFSEEARNQLEHIRKIIDAAPKNMPFLHEVQCLLGLCYKQIDPATDKPLDEKLSVDYFKLAADSNAILVISKNSKRIVNIAAVKYAHYFFYGKGGAGKDLKEAKKYYEKALVLCQSADNAEMKAIGAQLETKIKQCDGLLPIPPTKLKESKEKESKEKDKQLKRKNTHQAVHSGEKSKVEKLKKKNFFTAFSSAPSQLIAGDVKSMVDSGGFSPSLAELQLQKKLREDAQNEIDKAQALYDQGKDQEVIRILKDIKFPTKRSLMFLASVYRHNYFYQNSFKTYATLIEKFPNDVVVQARWLVALFDNGEGKDVFKRLENLKNNHPENIQVGLVYVGFLLRIKNFEAADKTLKNLMRQNPSYPKIKFMCVRYLRVTGQYSEAKKMLSDMKEARYSGYQFWKLKEETEISQFTEDQKQVEDRFCVLKENYPNHFLVDFLIFKYYVKIGEYLKALYFIKDGEINIKDSKSDESRTALDEVSAVILRDHKKNLPLLQECAYLFLKMKRADLFCKVVDHLSSNVPSENIESFVSKISQGEEEDSIHVDVRVLRARCIFFKDKDEQNIKSVFAKIIDDIPYYLASYIASINFYLERNNKDKVLELIDRALNNCGLTPRTYMYSARLLLEIAEIRRAQEVYGLSLKKLPENKLLQNDLKALFEKFGYSPLKVILHKTDLAVEARSANGDYKHSLSSTPAPSVSSASSVSSVFSVSPAPSASFTSLLSNPYVQYTLGKEYEKWGQGVIALEHYRIAADYLVEARYAIANIFASGMHGMEKDPEQAGFWRQKAIELAKKQAKPSSNRVDDSKSLKTLILKVQKGYVPPVSQERMLSLNTPGGPELPKLFHFS